MHARVYVHVCVHAYVYVYVCVCECVCVCYWLVHICMYVGYGLRMYTCMCVDRFAHTLYLSRQDVITIMQACNMHDAQSIMHMSKQSNILSRICDCAIDDCSFLVVYRL
jgi:hypothetical protein